MNALSPSPTARARLARGVMLLALGAAGLAVPLLLAANMANPVRPGDRVGEPSAALAGIVVEREDLEVDLRPLAALRGAVVQATYHLRNDGAARDLPLVFVADALDDSAGVWLNGRPVPVTATPADTALPESWRAPETTPAIGGGTLRYEAEGGYRADLEPRTATLLFRLPLDSGRQTVRVRYRARPTSHSHTSPAIHWQLGYVLAPARRWAGVDSLHARVLLPAGWSAAASPAMVRRGDTLVMGWDSIPADALALTARAPVPRLGVYQMVLFVLGAVALVGCIWAGMRYGQRLVLRRKRFLWAALPAVGLGLVWSTLVVAGLLMLPGMILDMLGNQRASGYGYGSSILAVLSWPVLFLFCVSVVLIAAHRGFRRAQRFMTNVLAPGF